MEFGVWSKLTLQRPRSQLSKGWVYTRHSLRFGILHPVVIVLGLLQLVISMGVFTGLSVIVYLIDPSSTNQALVISMIPSYFLTSIIVVLFNGTVAGYVLAAELGVLRPLSHAVSQMRNRLMPLVGYAVVWACAITVFVFLDWLARLGVLLGPLNLTLHVITFVMNLVWGVGTIFVVPILVFEPTTSLLTAIQRSISLLKESMLCLLVFWLVGIGIFILILSSCVAVLFLSTNSLVFIAPIVAVFIGAIICYILGTVFCSLLYGEVAGPLNIS